MGHLRGFFTPLHQNTSREYVSRMVDEKVHCMLRAKEYEHEYWDGDRRYGYGGYKYDGRWRPVAEQIIETYNLAEDARILDVGCGKAHLLYEVKKLLPRSTTIGFDVSEHGLADAPEGIRSDLIHHRAQDKYRWDNDEFDLVMSLGCLHNLRLFELQTALSEIERVGRQKYVMLESYRDEQELFNLQCWALTAESFLDTEEWLWLYEHFGYTGDYEFIYFN
jgi:ubiquinone/menaquinone biosynthesis C-methylase UbiE